MRRLDLREALESPYEQDLRAVIDLLAHADAHRFAQLVGDWPAATRGTIGGSSG